MFYVSIIKHVICVLVFLVGPLRVEFSDPVTLDLVRSENSGLQPGGRFKPTECIAQQKVALIIPFRQRDEHLKYWLYYLHPILLRQQLDYGIYVINQVCQCYTTFAIFDLRIPNLQLQKGSKACSADWCYIELGVKYMC